MKKKSPPQARDQSSRGRWHLVSQREGAGTASQDHLRPFIRLLKEERESTLYLSAVETQQAEEPRQTPNIGKARSPAPVKR